MRKEYGQSQVSQCPFCGGASYSKNPQGVAVCKDHTNHSLPDLKCVCGGWLDLRESKFGAFFTCMECGPVSMKKMLETNGEAIYNAGVSAPRKGVDESWPRERGEMPLDRIRRKLKNGEPLTLEELELL